MPRESGSRMCRHRCIPAPTRTFVVWRDRKVTEGFFHSMPDYGVTDLSIKHGTEYLTRQAPL
jgi:hypothetical protein